MSINTGRYVLGADNAKLLVMTKRGGAAARAGHDLTIEVTSWEATLDLAAGTVALTADARSFRVREGTGGIQKLGDDDKDGIQQTIEEEVISHPVIAFHSSAIDTGSDHHHLTVRGELELAGESGPITFELVLGEDDRLTGRAIVKQSNWGIKPYSALFGTLKVADEVEVTIDGALPGRAP